MSYCTHPSHEADPEIDRRAAEHLAEHEKGDSMNWRDSEDTQARADAAAHYAIEQPPAEPQTYLEPEEYAYPGGGQTRKGMAYYPDGEIRRVYAGIPDTFYTIPAHGRIAGRYVAGYLTLADWRDVEEHEIPEGSWMFNVRRPANADEKGEN